MDFEFPLVVDTLDDVPDQFKSLYEDKGEDGGIVLITDLAKKIGDQGSLSTAMAKERKRAADAEKALKSYQAVAKTPDELKQVIDGWKVLGDTPEAVKSLLDERETLLADKPDVTKAVEQVRAAKDTEILKVTTTLKGEIATKDAELKRTRDALHTEMIDAALSTEIVKQKGIARLLLPVIRSNVKIEEVDGRFVRKVVDAEGDPRINGKGEPFTLAELVAEAKADAELAYAFDAEGRGGSGSDPANGGGKGRSASKTYKLAAWQELVSKANKEERTKLLKQKAAGEIKVVSN